ncbi:MAG: acyltransferase family protein, partial [Lactovum sp.]
MKKEEVRFSGKIRQLSYIRVLGLFLVLFYHFYPKILTGGFLGVDIFFTFSGYLITALAIEEMAVKHSFNIRNFAEKRFFRIFPTLVFSIFVSLPFTFWGSSDLRIHLKQQVLAGLSFISNFYEAATGISYENNFAPHMYVHFWSLAIEVQFYVFFALLLWILSYYFRPAFKFLVFTVSLLLALLSFIALLVASFTSKDYSSLYYSSFLRVFPFFMGSAFASVVGFRSKAFIRKYARRHTVKGIQNKAILVSVILIILSFIFRFDWKITYILGFLLTSILTLSLIFFLRILHEKTEKEEPKVIQIISNLSYSVYLLHWPFLVIFRNYQLSSLISIILTLLLSFSLSALMFYVIDSILREKRVLSQPITYAFHGAVALLTVIATVALFRTTTQTSLTQTLWEGSNTQVIQTLYLSEKKVETGAFGADTLLVGDSVAHGTRVETSDNFALLESEIPNIFADTEGSRKISSDLEEVLKSDLTLLPKNSDIVIALGTNSIEPTKDIEILKKVIKEYSDHSIFLVTPANIGEEGPYNSDTIADWELSVNGRYDNVTVIDWRAVAQDHPEYLDVDGIHIADRSEGRS